MKKITSIAFILGVCSLLGVSCKNERPAESAAVPAPAQQAVRESGAPYQLELYPREATRKTVLRLSAYGFDAAAAGIEWFVDGFREPAPVPTEFACRDFPKGSKVKAKALVAGKEVWSDEVMIGNAPPDLTYVKLLPEVFRPGDVLMAEARAEDVDEDKTTIQYAWELNGAPAGNTEKLAVQPRRGDKITIRVTPFDGESHGPPLVLDREIRNLPPVFVEHQNFTFKENRYSYQAQAQDPDGDVLAYMLETSSEGVTIHPATGELVWTVPEGFTGDRTVTIVADDGHGGKARYALTFTIRE